MNENINLCEILKGCEGIKLYSPLCGECTFNDFTNYSTWKIRVKSNAGEFYYFGNDESVTSTGEVLLFPSRDEHDWSKFEKPSKFPKTYEEARSKFNEDILQCIDEDMRDLFKLIVIRNAWWGADDNWRPNWGDTTTKYALVCYDGIITTHNVISYVKTLSFHTEELRDKFLETHYDLIEKCKNYI